MKSLMYFVATALLLMGGAIVLVLGIVINGAEELMVVGLATMMLSGATWNKVEEIENE